MVKPEYIKRFDVGGVIDTESMLSDVKQDPRFFKDGSYTKSGRLRLAAIQEISDAQKAGNSYQFNEEGTEFKLVDKAGKLANTEPGHGVEVGKKAGIFYGLLNPEKKSKKEVSKVLADRKLVKGEVSDEKNDEAVLKNVANSKIINSFYKEGYTSKEDILKMSNGMFTPEEVDMHLRAIQNKSAGSQPNTTPKVVTPENKVEPVVNKDKSSDTPATPTSVLNTPVIAPKKAESTVNKDTMPSEQSFNNQFSINESVLGREINKHLEKTTPEMILSNLMNNNKLLNPDGTVDVDSVINTFDELSDVPNRQELEKKLNNSTYNGEWSNNQKSILNKRLQDLQSIKIKLINHKGQSLNKDQLKELGATIFAPVPKAQSGMVFGTTNYKKDKSKTALAKLKNGERSKDLENDLMDSDKSEWESHKLARKEAEDNEDFNNVDALADKSANNSIEDFKKGRQKIGDDYDKYPVAQGLKKDVVVSNRDADWSKPISLDGQNYNEQVLKTKAGLIKEQGGKDNTNNSKQIGSKLLRTAAGIVQPNDIVQLILARKAYKNPVAKVPVNLLKYTPHGARNVLAPRDLDYAMTKKAQENINQVRSGYNGSDPVLDAIMKQSAQGIKAGMKADLLGKKGDYRRQEEDRAYAEMEQHRQQAADDLQRSTDVYNTNNDRIRKADLQAAQNEQMNKAGWYKNLSTISADMQNRFNNISTTKKQMDYEISANENANKVAVAKDNYQTAINALKEAEISNRSGLGSIIDTAPLIAAVKKSQEEYAKVAGNTGNFIRSEMNRIGL